MSAFKILKWAKWIGLTVVSLSLLMYGLLAIGTVPAPNARNSEQITGKMAKVIMPQTEGGDLSIILDDGQTFYVNRVREVDHFDWELFLAEVQPGDEVTVVTVNTLAQRWGIFGTEVSPLAGIETSEKVYMDTTVAAQTWLSQARFTTIAICISLVLIASGYFLNSPKFKKRTQLNTA